jgi:adenosylcobinamide-GDP ribazoletransferase
VIRLVNAARYLTIFPIPGRPSPEEGPGASAGWFPVVGLVIGVVAAATDWVTTFLFTPLLGALVTVVIWKLMTGGLHLDGLADCLDGLAGRDPAQRLAIMRDSRVGTFGAAGLVLFLLLEVAAVSGIAASARTGALVLSPVVGRSLAPIVGRLFPPATSSGHGASFRAGLGAWTPVVTAGAALVVAVVAMGWPGVLGLALAGAVGLAFAAFMTRRLGGVTGDVHGAVIELGEVVVLLTAAATSPAR